MRCKACDSLLGDHGDLEMCEDCLGTIRPDFEVPIGFAIIDNENDDATSDENENV